MSLFAVKSPKLLERGDFELSKNATSAKKQENHLFVFLFLTANSSQKKRKETCHKTKGNARQKTTALKQRPLELTFEDIFHYRVDE